jgi:hypothetical protein
MSKNVDTPGITKKRFRQSMVDADTSKLPVLKGYLSKKNRHDAMQTRYFVTVNHYLNYYKNERRGKLLCSLDLLCVSDIEVTTRFGDIEISMSDGKLVSLKAKDNVEADEWVDNLKARHELYHTLPSHHKNQKSNESSMKKSDALKSLLQGYLKKMSPSRFRGWQERFFRLYNGEIRYYKTEPNDISELDGFNGQFFVTDIISVKAMNADPDCTEFNIALPQREFELQASNVGTMNKWMKGINDAIQVAKEKEQQEKKEQEGKVIEKVVNIPQCIREFDQQDPNERAAILQQEGVFAFEEKTEDMDDPDSVDNVMNICTEVLEELTDVVDACLSQSPKRYDVIQEYLQAYQGMLLFKVTNFTNEAEVGDLEAHEALRLMDFILAYTCLIDKAFKDNDDESLKALFNTDVFKEELNFLRDSYCIKAKPTLTNMCENIAKLTLQNPAKAINEGYGGKYHTPASVDLFSMINEYVAIAGRGGMKELQVEVIKMCLGGIKKYQKCMEEGIVGLEEPADALLLLCAIINDCDEIADNLDSNIEEQYEDLLEEFDIEKEMDAVRVQCQTLSRYSTGIIKNVIFKDLEEIEDHLFDLESWGKQENLDACISTIDDYLGDFVDRIVDISYLTLVGFCFSEIIKMYVKKLLEKFTKVKKIVKSKSSSSGGNYVEKEKLSDEQIEYIKHDMETLRVSFGEHINDGGSEMARKIFRQQWGVTCDIVDVLTTDLENIEQGVFVRIRSDLGLTKKTITPYVYAFVSTFLLLRNNVNETERHKVLEDCRKMMDAEEFTIENLRKMVNQMKNVELFSQHMSENAQNIATKLVESDGKVLIEQIYPNAYQQCIGDHDLLISLNKSKKRRDSLRTLTQTPLKSLGVVAGSTKGKMSKFSVSKAIFSFASSKKKAKKTSPSPTKKVAHEMPEEARQAIYKLYVDGTISKDEYESMINKHREFKDETLRMAEEAEKEALENQRLHELSKQGPFANAQALLQNGQITQEEYDQLIATIEGAKRAELGIDSSSKTRKRAESESTHNPLKAAKKMLDQGVITQAEYDEIAGKINQAKHEQEHGATLVSSPSSSPYDTNKGSNGNPFEPANPFLTKIDSNSSNDTQNGKEDDNLVDISLPPLPDEAEDDADAQTNGQMYNQDITDHSSILTHIKKMRGYLDKQNKHSSLKWNRRWLTVQYLEDEHDGDVKVQIAWHKNHNSEVLNSIPMVVVDRAWCKLQPGSYVDPDGVIKLPNQCTASIREQISEDDIKKGKKGQKNIFYIRACAGTDHERVLTLKSQSTSNMIEWVNNLNAVIKLLHKKKAAKNWSAVRKRVSVMFDELMSLEDDRDSTHDSFDDSFMSPLSSRSNGSPPSSGGTNSSRGRTGSGKRKKGIKSNRQSYFAVDDVALKRSVSGKHVTQKSSSNNSKNLNSILDELENLDMGVGAGKVRNSDSPQSHSSVSRSNVRNGGQNEKEDAAIVPGGGGGCCVIS